MLVAGVPVVRQSAAEATATGAAAPAAPSVPAHAARRYRGQSRAEVMAEAERLRERESLRDILDLQCARGTAPNYLGRAEGADYEYLLEAGVSMAEGGLVCLRETAYDARTRKAVMVNFYDRAAAEGARGFLGRSAQKDPTARANANAWLDAWERIRRQIEEMNRAAS